MQLSEHLAELLHRPKTASAAAAEHRDLTESLNAADPRAVEHDPDSEAARLFYREFYEDGPDVGRFVDSPNDWGHVLRLAPEDEVETLDLYGVADTAMSGSRRWGCG